MQRKMPFAATGPTRVANNGLQPIKEALPDDSYSYPSGHSAYGATLGILLSQMLPEKKSEIYARINDYARSRMVAGVHYRSDVEAGKLIGAAIGVNLWPEIILEMNLPTQRPVSAVQRDWQIASTTNQSTVAKAS